MHPREIDRRRAEHTRLRRAATTIHDTSLRRAYTHLRVSLREWPDTKPQLEENRLVADFGFSRNSIRKALQMLADDGLVSRAPRFGTIVAHRERDVRMGAPRAADPAAPASGGLTAVVLEHRVVELGGEGAERFVMTRELVSAEDPLFVRTVLTPMTGAREPGMPDRVTVRVMACAADMARVLSINVGDPLLVRSQLLRTRSGRVAELTYTHFRGDRIRLCT